MRAYYNEIDPFCGEWLRNLIAAGHIAPGDVDERDIRDVRPDDLRGYTQCHFFAGIGVWSHALRRAGWDDSREIWTGSCPCQPFSSAGKRQGAGDERHLWPVWFDLIRECKPRIVVGEQVASADVVGRSKGSVDHLRRLRDREELRRLSHDFLASEVSGYVQGLPERTRAQTPATRAVEDSRTEKELAFGEQRLGAGIIGTVSSQDSQRPVRSLNGGHPEADRPRSVRVDWDSFQLGGRLGRTVDRPNRLREGLCSQQRARSSSCFERNDEPLGAGESSSCGGRYASETGSEDEKRYDWLFAGDSIEETRSWLDLVQDDLEGAGYAVGASDLCAAGFSGAHIRQRLYFVGLADDTSEQRKWRGNTGPRRWPEHPDSSSIGGLADALRSGAEHERGAGLEAQATSDRDDRYLSRQRLRTGVEGASGGLAYHHSEGRSEQSQRNSETLAGRQTGELEADDARRSDSGGVGNTELFLSRWDAGAGAGAQGGAALRAERDDAGASGSADRPHTPMLGRTPVDWLFCRDGKWRPIEPGTFPLSFETAGRVGKLRAYGNSLDAETATQFLSAVMTIDDYLDVV